MGRPHSIPNSAGVAVIGCGYWGVNYIRIFAELPGAELVAICDARPERLHEIGDPLQGVALATDLDAVLDNPDVDAVVICTGATTHYAVARRCLEAGKHVLVEKPITTLVTDATQLMHVADERHRVLMVGHTFLYNPAVQRVREYLRDEADGCVYYLYSRRTNMGPIRHDVNAIWDLAPHDVSIFNYLLDSTPLWVSAVGVNALKNGRADAGFIALEYPGGIVGHIHVSWADPHKVRELVVVNSNKRIVFDDLNALERIRIYEKGVAPLQADAANYGEHQFHMRDGDIISPHIEVSEPLKNQCKHFLECVAEGRQPLTDGRGGRAVVEVMEAIDLSIRNRGAPISLDAVGTYRGFSPLTTEAPRAESIFKTTPS